MFKLSSIRDDYLISDIYNDINIHKNRDGLPLQYFEMSLPIMIHTVSARINTENLLYTSLCLAPDFYAYYSFTKEEDAISAGNDGSSHQHNFFELIYVLRGDLQMTIENENCTFSTGDGCLINKNVEHREIRFGDNTLVFYLQISTQYALSLLSPQGSFLFKSESSNYTNVISDYLLNAIHSKNNLQKDYLDLTLHNGNSHVLKTSYHLCENISKILLFGSFGATYALMGEILQLFSILGNTSYYSINRINLNYNTDSVLFSRITSLMLEANGRLGRNELQKKLGYNGVHLNDIVKKYTGMTIFEYGTTFCLQKVQDLLINTDMSVSEIAETLNFTNRTHFYRLFEQKYHMTPAEYRKSKRG